jgi:hypothetical protein
MATFQLFNHTARKLMAGEFAAADTYKCMLLNATAAFNAAHTKLTEVSNANAYEVYGNGWTQLGETLANVAISTITTNDAMFDADDIVKAITTGGLAAYKALVIYDDTDADDPPLAYLQLTDAVTTPAGVSVAVFFPADGIVKGTVA